MAELDSWDVTWDPASARGTKVNWQTAGGNEPFANPVDVAVSENGNVFVLDAGLGRIFRLGNAGNVTGEFGRSGTGPGELGKRLVRLFLGPDGTVYVPNPSARKLEQFGPNGTYRGSLAMPFGSGLPVGYAVFSPDSVFRAASTLGRDAQGVGMIEPAVQVSRLLSDSAQVIAQLPAGSTPQTGMYAAMPVWAASRTGVFLGSTDRFELQHYDSTFSLVGVWKSSLKLPALTASDIAVLADQELGHLGAEQRQQTIAALLQRMGFAKHYPPWSAMVISGNGDVWLNLPATADDIRAGDAPRFTFDQTGSRRWLVYAPDGSRSAEVQVPAGFVLKQIHDGRLYGIGADPDGSPVVQALDVSSH